MSKLLFVISAILCIAPIYCSSEEKLTVTGNWLVAAATHGRINSGSDCSSWINITSTDEECKELPIFKFEAEDLREENKAPIVIFYTEAELRTALAATYNCSDPDVIFYVKEIEEGYGLILFSDGDSVIEFLIVAIEKPTKAKVQELIEKVKPFVTAAGKKSEDMQWAISCGKE